MANNWYETTWGELATLEYGKGIRGYNDAEGAYRVFGTNGPVGWHDTPIYDKASVIVGRKGAYRGIHYSPEPFFVIDTAFYLKPKVEFDMRWAYYQLLTKDINAMDSGSAIPSTSRDEFYHLSVKFPPLEEQRRIARILGTLDDKIELNRQLNTTLEKIACTLFLSWFVDFDPVRAKASGEPEESICSRLDLTPELLALFPEALDTSIVGEIPVGWEISKADDLVKISIGKTPPRKEPEWFSTDATDVAWVSIRDMGDSGVYLAQTSEFLTDAAIKKHNVKLVPANTLILSFKLTVGRVAITSREMATNEAIAHFTIGKNSPLSSEFLYLYLKQFDYSILGSTSSIATAVNSQSIKGIPIICPPIPIVQAFQIKVKDLFEAIKTHEIESRTLASLRNELLPKFLSGELRTSTNSL